MGIFNNSTPPNTEAVKLGAAAIRALKTDLNTLLSQLFNDDGTLKTSAITTDEITDLAVTTGKIAALAITTAKIAVGALSADTAGHALMADGYLSAFPGVFAGRLVIGHTYMISSLESGDNFSNAGFVTEGAEFVATATTPTAWLNGTQVIDTADGSVGTTTGPLLVVGRTYNIASIVAADNFSNVGYVSNNVHFVATGTTPTVWTHGTIVVDVDSAAAQAKLSAGLLSANAAGRAIMQDGFITTEKFAPGSVSTEKIADGAVTLAKIGTDVGNAQAIARWTGAGYHQNVVSKTLPGSNRFTVSSFSGTLPVLGFGVTLQNAPCGIIVNNVTATGADPTSGAGWNWGRMYYIYAWDNVTISLHTSPQGAIDGTTGIVATGTGPMTGSGTYYLKFLDPSTVYKRGCDIVPVVSAASSTKIHGFRIIWRTPWASAGAGIVQVEQHYPSSANSNTIEVLRPSVITSADTTVCYIVDGANDWKTGSSDNNISDIQDKAGSNMVVAYI